MNIKYLILFSAFFLIFFLFISCSNALYTNSIKQEIFNTEKSFEKMCAEKGIQEAFYFFLMITLSSKGKTILWL